MNHPSERTPTMRQGPPRAGLDGRFHDGLTTVISGQRLRMAVPGACMRSFFCSIRAHACSAIRLRAQIRTVPPCFHWSFNRTGKHINAPPGGFAAGPTTESNGCPAFRPRGRGDPCDGSSADRRSAIQCKGTGDFRCWAKCRNEHELSRALSASP